MKFLTILILLSSMSMNQSDKLDLIIDTVFEQHQINFTTSQYDIYRKDHNPQWKGNFEGGGVYVYEGYTIYFNNIVGYYEEIFIDQIQKDTYPERFYFNNEGDVKDLKYLLKCLGKAEIKKNDNVDDQYYERDEYKYYSKKYDVSFIVNKNGIEGFEVIKHIE